jgi:RNA polymerase sigma-70 factor (ECF subfamily)
MHEARLEGLFERFRRRGDVAALGEVFDAAAPELLRVAMALGREPADADDLLQQTFLTAIERAERYDAERRLVPWLLGILVHHARDRRRLARRPLDPTRLARPAPRTPPEALLDAEVEQALEQAFRELSTRDRVVLEAYLAHGKGAAQIAHELGGSPGAVRMQIHRGLERLRKLLPAGLAVGAAGGALSAQGLDVVRANVLSAAERVASTLLPPSGARAPTSVNPPLETIGVLMGKKVVAVALALALCALLWNWMGRERAPGFGDSGENLPARASAPTAPVEEFARSAERADPLGEQRREVGRAASTLEGDALVGALRGRLVERSGAPVAGMPVALLELQDHALFASLEAGAAPTAPRLFAAQATSDSAGVFVLSGARTFGALHALGIDLGGARPSVRVLDVAFVAGECAELGDIVLAPTAVVRGRVVDEHGAPVAGARVRAGALTDFLVQHGLYELGAGAALGELRSSGSSNGAEELASDGLQVRYLFEVPAWLGELEERLPLVTARTNERGEFVLAQAPTPRADVLVDRPGRMTTLAATRALEANGELDLGTIVLDAGRTLAGRVLDASGKPIAGAQVRGGRIDTARSPAVFGAVQSTAADGGFRLTGVSTRGQALVIARRDAASSWTPLLAGEGALELRLPREAELLVKLVDPSGAPIDAPRFEFAPSRETANLGAFPSARQDAAATSLGAGRWSLGLRREGEHDVCVRAPGFASRTVTCRVPLSDPVEIVLEPAVSLDVRVTDAASGAGIAGALVTVESTADREGQVASQSTDPSGRAVLELLRSSGRLIVRARHPHYAPRSTPVDPARTQVVLALDAGGGVIARADPQQFGSRRHMLVLEYRGAPSQPESGFPLLAVFGADGIARRERLPAGRWSWSVVESLAHGEALAFLGDREGPRPIVRGEFELAEGERLELDVGAAAGASTRRQLATSVVHGLVRVNGAPAEHIELDLISMTAGVVIGAPELSDSSGAFRFDAVKAGRYSLSSRIKRGGAFVPLGSEQFELAHGESRRFTLEYATCDLEVEVRDDAGAVVSGAELVLDVVGGRTACQARTDRAGRATLLATQTGKFSLTATHPRSGSNTVALELARQGAQRVEVRLDRGVPCSGTARFAAGRPAPASPVALFVSRAEDYAQLAELQLTFERNQARFSIVGLRPGRYTVTPHFEGTPHPGITLVVPEGGSETLELVLGQPPPAPPGR